MKNNLFIFFVFLIVGFGGGYLFFQNGGQEQAVNPSTEQEQEVEETEETSDSVTVNTESSIFNEKGCLSCHAVSKLGLDGGVTGPDLSDSYENIEGKHGKPLDEFLKEPTSAVMSGVISGNPLSDEEIAKIVEELQEVAQK